ncbi:MAG: cell division ATP-binding protein FtsE [Clostridia bacterium]|nr:cell division ATP-binding protein FtsE [Clostridia bacterium]
MIEFQSVYKTYQSGSHALRDVNLRIEDGEFAFIVGASGAGKSTFLKLIMREEVPTSGEVTVNNYHLSRIKRKQIPFFRRTMGIVFQDFRLINTMTVYENVAFSMRVIGKTQREIKRRVNYVLQLLDLQGKGNRYPLELSGGEQQRVGLARALVNNPSLIIADEPTGNVDPQMSRDIVDMLSRINEKGTTVLMVTHQHDLVQEFPHRVITLEGGRIVSDTGRPLRAAATAKGGAAL